MAWRAARSLTALHAQLKRGAPRAAPPATEVDAWGLIGDAEHDPTSDHSPHNFPGLGNQVVTAADFPNAPALGLDAHKVLDDIRRSRDDRVKYGISNGQMFSSYAVTGYPAWTWRPYGGKDGHFTHGHLSVVGDARADDTRPWQTIGAPSSAAAADTEEEDMGQSFGPVQLEQGTTSLCIPPVQGGLADPRKVWINIGGDLGLDVAALRVWVSDGKTWTGPLKGDGFDAEGVVQLANGKVVSAELAAGVRLLSITRVPAKGQAQVFARSISVCFERQ